MRHPAVRADAVAPQRRGMGWGVGRVTSGLLGVCVLGWSVLAGYLFLVPDPEELTEAVHPTLGHAVIFAALGATAMARIHGHRRGSALRLFAAGVAGGIVVELAQHQLTSGRASQVGDVVADAVGLALGIAIVLGAHRLLGRAPLVAGTTAVASATLLLALATVVVVGPRQVRAWWGCRQVAAEAGDLLLRLDAAGVTVPGDSAVAADLERQLSPLRAGAGYRFERFDRVSVASAPSVACALRQVGAFTLVAQLDDVASGQEGPARIVSLSHGTSPNHIDLQLGLSGDSIVVRLRTSGEELHQVRVPGVVDGAALGVTVTAAYDGEVLEVSSGSRVVRERLDADPSAWRHDEPLTIGNERSGGRGLTGTITGLELFAGMPRGPGTSTYATGRSVVPLSHDLT